MAPLPSVVDHDLDVGLVVDVSDPDGDPVQVSLLTAPEWLNWEPSARRLSGVPGAERIGTSGRVVLTASDGESASRIDQTLAVRVGTSRLIFDGVWGQQTPHNFGHDGHPVVSRRVVVHGAFASDSVRAWLSDYMEQRLDHLGERLGVVDESRYEFPHGGRIQVFADRYQGDRASGYTSIVNGWAFRDGLILMSPDAPRRTRLGYTQARLESLITHELMHVVEFMLIGRDNRLHATDTWFREGVATYMGGFAPGGLHVESVDTDNMASWRATHAQTLGGGNPVSVRAFSDFPSGIDTGSYYLWFAQAVRYMVAPEGLGLGEEGLKAIYDDVYAGFSFEQSFQQRTGISVATFEAEIWDRLGVFLGG